METLRQHIERLLEERDARFDATYISHDDLDIVLDKLREGARRDHAEIIAGRQGLIERVETHIAQWEAWKVGVDQYIAANQGEELGTTEQASRNRNMILVTVAVTTVLITIVDLLLNHWGVGRG